MTQEMWDERYSAPQRVWSGNPNPWLVEVAADMEPGTALDVGCGEGADAIWLAERGWDVTGIDFSAAGLAHAAEQAEQAGVPVHWVRTDLTEWAPEERFDLVSVQFFHAEPAVRRAVHRAAWAATGGTLLLVGHDDSHPGPPPAEVRYPVAEILAELGPDAHVEVAETRTRGDSVDAVVVAHRRSQSSE